MIADNSNMHTVLSRVNDVTEIRDRHGTVMGTYTPKGKADNGSDRHLMLMCFEDGAYRAVRHEEGPRNTGT